MPAWLLIACMILTTYRASRLAVKDTFPPVLWLRDRLAGGWRPLTDGEMERHPEVDSFGTEMPTNHERLGTVMRIDDQMHRYVRRVPWSPYWLAELVSCPWCVSGWLSAGITAAVALTVGVPAPLLVWGAVWAGGALLASREWS